MTANVFSYQHTQRGNFILKCTWLFHSLTIAIGERELCWRFGPGLIHKRVALAEITAAEPVQTTFLQGWGIHLTRQGWLYNVSGREAVAITLRSGRRFLLGTNEPQLLATRLGEVIQRNVAAGVKH